MAFTSLCGDLDEEKVTPPALIIMQGWQQLLLRAAAEMPYRSQTVPDLIRGASGKTAIICQVGHRQCEGVSLDQGWDDKLKNVQEAAQQQELVVSVIFAVSHLERERGEI